MMRFPLSIALIVVACVATGCSQSKYDLVSVSGTVTMDGQPLEGASVKFQPQGGGIMSYGKTDAQGRYALQTMADDPGAMVATHAVSIYKSSGTVDLSTEEAQPAVKQLVPEKYNYKTTLSFQVSPGGTTRADWSLESK